jgi:hypothetical protein
MRIQKFYQNTFIRNEDGLFLFLIVIINLLIKAIPAAVLELGNDEVYYWTYALFPDWSHFDHPPMVGFLIQLFSLNLHLKGDLFIRAGALVLSSVNILILFSLVKRLYSRQAAYFAAIMFISSFYFNIISGLFILPDTPQVFFVLLALYFIVPVVTVRNPTKKDNFGIIMFGLLVGLAFLSKYHSLFLWFGAGLYILLHNRIWFKKPALYLSLLLTIILSIPVIYWNIKNNFISFTFQGDRIGLLDNKINFNSFIQFNAGQFFYQNPVLVIIYIIAIFKTVSKIGKGIKETDLFLLYSGIPLILAFTVISLFRSTLPHWTGPAFICLIILSSEYLADLYNRKKVKVRNILISASCIYIFVLIFGTLQINFGIIKSKAGSESAYAGKNDFTLDMYGWKQAREKFTKFLEKEGIPDTEHQQLAIVSDNWYPAAHLDYYIAHPLNIRLNALGPIGRIHKYYWINKTRKLNKTDRIFYITDSRNYHDPGVIASYFSEIIPKDTLNIVRNNKTVKYIYIYDMVGFKPDSIPNSPLPGF